MAKDMELSQQNVADILRIIRQLGPEIPSMIWGSPGIGKTEATKQAFGHDHEIVLVLAGCSEPTDISGVPHPYVDEHGANVATDVLVPLWAYNASEFAPPEHQGPMVIFFDDIVTGHEQTQAACFKVFGEKRVGNLPLRDNVYIIGAGNRIEDKSAAFEMPLALANRMKHYYAKSDVDAWVAWATDIGGIHPLITAYIRTQGNALNRFDEIVETSTSEKAFPTPRTWELLSKSMFKIDPSGNIQGNWLYPAAVGCIGAGTGMEFNTFAKNTTTLVRPEDIVNDPKNARVPDKTEIDVLYATITALEYYINQKAHHKHWVDALTYVLREEMEPEYGLLIAKMATTIAFNKLSEKKRIAAAQTPEFQEMYRRWGCYLANPDA
jgi:hypothetical protein